jgi:hypothetical protein
MTGKEKKIYVLIALTVLLVFAIAFLKGTSEETYNKRVSDTSHNEIVGTWVLSDFKSSDPDHNLKAYMKEQNITKPYKLECIKGGSAELVLYDKKEGKVKYSGIWQWSKKKEYYFVKAGPLTFKMNIAKDGNLFNSVNGKTDDDEMAIWESAK